jgi:hypothetical protein
MKRTATAAPTPPSRDTFDVVTPPTRAPRVAWHDAHLRPYGEGLIPDAACQAIPLEAFGPVASLDRQRYFTHDNGGRPYLVRVDAARRRATVRRNLAPGVRRGARYVVTYDKVVKRVDYVRFWNGYAPFNNSVDYDGAIGNTLLFEVTRGGRRSYLLIAGMVVLLELPEGHPPIAYFSASLGNNDVPYPYAWSDRYVYFFAGGAEVEYTDLARVAAYVKTGDIASLFYGHRDWVSGAYTYAMKKKQRAALAALPRETLRARAIHTRSAGV